MGNVVQAGTGQALARQAAIFAGIPDTVDKAPKKLPIGVLAADTITTSLFILWVLNFTWCKNNQFLGKIRVIYLL